MLSQVEFEDGSQVLAKREDVYTLDEDLPKKVKRRLVSISGKLEAWVGLSVMTSLCTHQSFLPSRFVVDGLQHAFWGRLLHHARGEEETEDSKLPLSEWLCGPAGPPYTCQKHMGAAPPQGEMKGWRKMKN